MQYYINIWLSFLFLFFIILYDNNSINKNIFISNIDGLNNIDIIYILRTASNPFLRI